MKNVLRASIALVATSLIVTPALAEYTKPVGLSVRAGIFFAQGRAADAEGQNWFTAGGEYKLGDLSFKEAGYSAHYSLSLDYYGKGGFTSLPLLLNYVSRTPNFYYSVGAGVASTHVRVGGSTSTDTEFAYQLSIGKDFVQSKMPVFVELRYFGNNKTDMNGFALVGGIRF